MIVVQVAPGRFEEFDDVDPKVDAAGCLLLWRYPVFRPFYPDGQPLFGNPILVQAYSHAGWLSVERKEPKSP